MKHYIVNRKYSEEHNDKMVSHPMFPDWFSFTSKNSAGNSTVRDGEWLLDDTESPELSLEFGDDLP